MKKLLFTCAAILLYQGVPMLGQPSLLLHWKMLIVITTAAVLWLSQPAIRTEEANANKSKDHSTIWLILGMAGVSTIIPELEWAYFRQNTYGVFLWNVTGIALIVSGLLFRLWAIRTLGRFFTGTVQTSSEHQLVTTGPYTLVRHPSYLGAFVAILGISVLFQAWLGLLVATIAMSYAYYHRIKVEEAALLDQFGEHYAQYVMNRKRMLPGIW